MSQSGMQKTRDTVGTLMGWMGSAKGRLASYSSILDAVNQLEAEMREMTREELRKCSLSLRFRAKSGEPVAKFLADAYALVREAARRTLQMRHFDVQIIGGIAMYNGCIVEMETGEGKTLAATLPMYIHALVGKGTHLATVNDYLADRDADTMRPVYDLLGLTVGVIQTQDTQDARRRAYRCDITYGTAKEFGFDFMRDRLLLRRMGHQQADFLGSGSAHRWEEGGDQPVQRVSHFSLVDEADSILIDEARTPLIIGSLGDTVRDKIVEAYRWAAKYGPTFVEDEHYEVDYDTKKIELLLAGRAKVRGLPRSKLLNGVGLQDMYDFIKRAIKVDRDYKRDRQYVVRDGEIVIVDEFTGRLGEGRKWRDGIHQAVEAKENVEVTVPTGQAARITVQDMFMRYKHLAGMTGTAVTSAREFRKIYKMPVVRIPTNRPVQRSILPPAIFGSEAEKWSAIVREVQEQHQRGRPVLIGTRSIDKSTLLSRLLADVGVPHNVLNAYNIAEEAEIVERAGEAGRVTVATNMAGRGTDIKLTDDVKAKGGLHVICTEFHDSARIDRQLAGRCGRQGDPGSVRQYLALDDEILLTGLGPGAAKRLEKSGVSLTGEGPRWLATFRRAQARVEKKHFQDRSVLLHHEKQRKKMQREMGQDPYLDTADS